MGPPVFLTVFGKHALSTKDPLQDESVDASTALRAGDDLTLLKMRMRRSGVIAGALAHDVSLRLCYCSINSRCWKLQSSTRSAQPSVPQPVSACTEHYSIGAPTSGLID